MRNNDEHKIKEVMEMTNKYMKNMDDLSSKM